MLDNTNVYYSQVKLLIAVLPFVSKEKNFALKGGTAINLFIRDLPRLSVDIDLMYLPVESREDSLRHISEIFERIATDIETRLSGTKVIRIRQRQDEDLTKLQVEKGGVAIKIEASPVTRGTVREASERLVSLKVEEEFGFVETLVVDIDDLYAGKICAALDRQHPRDFFDVRGLLDNEGITDNLMDVLIVYIISSNQPISKLLKPNLKDLKDVYEEQFVGMTVDPVSLELIERTREELINQIHQKLTDNHRKFLIGFKKGEPDWSLLPFENIDKLPSVKWKMINLDKMKKEKRLEALKKLEEALHIKGD